MKLEVNKIYTDGLKKVKCVAVLTNDCNKSWPFVCTVVSEAYPEQFVTPFLVDINGDSTGSGVHRLTKEVKEPVWLYLNLYDSVFIGANSYPTLEHAKAMADKSRIKARIRMDVETGKVEQLDV